MPEFDGQEATICGSMKVKIATSHLIKNTENRKLKFKHNFGKTPNFIQIQFSQDDSFDQVTILQWGSWGFNVGNPVTIAADTENVYLNISPSGPLNGSWDGLNNQWTTVQNGYFRVIMGL